MNLCVVWLSMKKFSQTIFPENPVKKLRFNDFNGAVKSLGAWGGDFVMAVSNLSTEDNEKYFSSKGHDYCLNYKEIIAENSLLTKEISERTYH